jgi:hypothetical protein
MPLVDFKYFQQRITAAGGGVNVNVNVNIFGSKEEMRDAIFCKKMSSA